MFHFVFFQDAKLVPQKACDKAGVNEMGYWLNEVMAVTGYNCRFKLWLGKQNIEDLNSNPKAANFLINQHNLGLIENITDPHLEYTIRSLFVIVPYTRIIDVIYCFEAINISDICIQPF